MSDQSERRSLVLAQAKRQVFQIRFVTHSIRFDMLCSSLRYCETWVGFVKSARVYDGLVVLGLIGLHHHTLPRLPYDDVSSTESDLLMRPHGLMIQENTKSMKGRPL